MLELCEGSDTYGRPIVRDVASIGGVEAMARADYMADVIHDLAAELPGDGPSATASNWDAASPTELADALDGLADGQSDDLGQMLHAAVNRLREVARDA